jgi:hypothetical protein
MAKNWLQAIELKADAWNIPQSEAAELAALITTAEQCLRITRSSERTIFTTAQCKAAFSALIAKMRFIKNRFFLSPPLVDADYPNLELKRHDLIMTNIPVPVNTPGVKITQWAPHSFVLQYSKAVDNGNSAADYGIRVYYGLVPPTAPFVSVGEISSTHLADGIYKLSAHPTLGEALPNSFFTPRKKDILELPPISSGYTCYLAARFENSKGKSGPWGPMIHAIVP